MLALNRLENAKHRIENIFDFDELAAWRNDDELWTEERRQIGLKMNYLFSDVLPFPMTLTAEERTSFMERVSFGHINAAILDEVYDTIALTLYENDFKIARPMPTWEYCRTSCIRYTEIWELLASTLYDHSVVVSLLHYPESNTTKQMIEKLLRDFEENGGRTMVDALFEGVPLEDIIGGRANGNIGN